MLYLIRVSFKGIRAKTQVNQNVHNTAQMEIYLCKLHMNYSVFRHQSYFASNYIDRNYPNWTKLNICRA